MNRIAKFMMRSAVGAVGSFFLSVMPAQAKPVTYVLPEETAAFKAGPDLDVVQGNCAACHSADYIQSQPRGPNFGKAFWQAEVTKMIKVYGAPISEADVGKIVDYLVKTSSAN
jgi:mono/diheme cytochrome c family protein